MYIIEAKGLTKHFTVYKREQGLRGLIKNMVKPEKHVVKAVDGIDFCIRDGEIVGFIGQNGAGKSTTIKMMTGILMPTNGSVKINGIEPYRNRAENAKNIGVVFGHRTQLWWNLPVIDSFNLLRTIYKIPTGELKKNMDIFTEILEIDRFLYTQVRQLSLGQRMRVEIAASMLHTPKILFLDEPTIGLDVLAKERIREFILRINKESGVTVILTTHDIGDIEKLCKRIIMIDKGHIIYDGDINVIKDLYGKERVLVIDLEDDDVGFATHFGTVINEEGSKKHILFNKDEISAIDLVSSLSKLYRIKDFALVETDIENIIKNIYRNRITL